VVPVLCNVQTGQSPRKEGIGQAWPVCHDALSCTGFHGDSYSVHDLRASVQLLVQPEPHLSVGQLAPHLRQSPLPRPCILGTEQTSNLTEHAHVLDCPREALVV
jgi:hypothetical protein